MESNADDCATADSEMRVERLTWFQIQIHFDSSNKGGLSWASHQNEILLVKRNIKIKLIVGSDVYSSYCTCLSSTSSMNRDKLTSGTGSEQLSTHTAVSSALTAPESIIPEMQNDVGRRRRSDSCAEANRETDANGRETVTIKTRQTISRNKFYLQWLRVTR